MLLSKSQSNFSSHSNLFSLSLSDGQDQSGNKTALKLQKDQYKKFMTRLGNLFQVDPDNLEVIYSKIQSSTKDNISKHSDQDYRQMGQIITNLKRNHVVLQNMVETLQNREKDKLNDQSKFIEKSVTTVTSSNKSKNYCLREKIKKIQKNVQQLKSKLNTFDEVSNHHSQQTETNNQTLSKMQNFTFKKQNPYPERKKEGTLLNVNWNLASEHQMIDFSKLQSECKKVQSKTSLSPPNRHQKQLEKINEEINELFQKIQPLQQERKISIQKSRKQTPLKSIKSQQFLHSAKREQNSLRKTVVRQMHRIPILHPRPTATKVVYQPPPLPQRFQRKTTVNFIHTNRVPEVRNNRLEKSRSRSRKSGISVTSRSLKK